MKQSKKRISLIAGMLVIAMLVSMMPIKTVNAAGKPKKLVTISGKESKTVKVDMTGNGRDNTIEFISKLDKNLGEDFVGSLKIVVDGKTAFSKKLDSYELFHVEASYMKLDSSNILLHITGTSFNDYIPYNRIYKFNNKTYKLDLVKTFKNGWRENVISYTSDSIVVKCSYQSEMTGWGTWKYTYNYADGVLKLKNPVASYQCGIAYGLEDDFYRHFLKNEYIAAKDLVFYTTVDGDEEAFRANAGSILTIKKIYTNTLKHISYQFIDKNGKKGWITIPKNSYSAADYFLGVNERLAG